MQKVFNNPYVIYAAFTLLILLPLLLPGFVLTLDMVFVPDPAMPTELSSSYIFYLFVYAFSHILPADFVQKLILVAIVLGSALGAYKLTAHIFKNNIAAYFAGVFYVLNPFVYARFMTGQFAVLLGYALLPFFVLLLLRLIKKPDLKNGIWLGLLAALISVVSIHSTGLVAVLAFAILASALWQIRAKKDQLLKIVKSVLLAFAIWLVASSYWLVPLLFGKNSTASNISSFSSQDYAAFAVTGGSWAESLLNILRLQGFWAESYGMFSLPQHFTPAWGIFALLLLILVGYGAVKLWQSKRWLCAALLAVLLIAILFASGVLNNLWGASLLAGYREPHKFVGLIALVYAIFAASALVKLKSKIVIYGSFLLPILITPCMLWGFWGQLKPVAYPADWYSANETAKESRGAILFLPWHQYMLISFAGRTIENPAQKFFDAKVISSDDPEFNGVKSLIQNTDSERAAEFIKNPQDFAKNAAELNVEYIFVAKEFDFGDYDFLSSDPNMQVISDTDNLIIYKNLSWSQ